MMGVTLLTDLICFPRRLKVLRKTYFLFCLAPISLLSVKRIFVLTALFFYYMIFFVGQPDLILLDPEIGNPNHMLPAVGNKTTRSGVPLLFHQMWKDANIPREYLQRREECLRLNPEFQPVLWTDIEIAHFVSRYFPQFYSNFLAYPFNIQRVDVARYLILLFYGGVYLDLDTHCKSPFKDIVMLLNASQNVLLPQTDIYGLTNSFMVSKPRSRFFHHVLSELPKHASGSFRIFRHTAVIFSTGPMFLTRCMESFNSSSELYVMSLNNYNNQYFLHEKSGSWHSWDTEVVDMFHFHYFKVLVFVIFAICGSIYCIGFKKRLHT